MRRWEHVAWRQESILLVLASSASAFTPVIPGFRGPSTRDHFHQRGGLSSYSSWPAARPQTQAFLRLDSSENASANAALGAALVPVYRALAAIALWQATRATPWVDAMVLIATAIAASFDLGPAAQRQLASATKAQQRARPPPPRDGGTPGGRSRPGRLTAQKAADQWNLVGAGYLFKIYSYIYIYTYSRI